MTWSSIAQRRTRDLPLRPGRALALARLEAGVEEVAAAVRQPVVAVEAARGRQRALVPFAGDQCPIADGPQHLAEGCAVFHVIVTDAISIVSGEQFGSRRVALGRVVELREAEALLGKLVDVRRIHLAAVAADVRVPHVVDHDENDIWLRFCRRQG